MKNRKMKKRFSIFGAALLAFSFMIQGMCALVSDVAYSAAYAISGNSVAFKEVTAEASNNNIVYVDLIATGQKGDTIKVSYKTFSRTAIRNVDFVSVENIATIKLNSFEEKFTIAILCLNNTNTREKFRVYDKSQTYGRFFDLKITGVENAQIVEGKDTCKCYLPYDYKVGATVGIYDTNSSREVAYLNDYKTMLMQYDGGTGGLDGHSTRKTWEKGISFDNETTRRWISTYINTGFANAYGSFLIKKIDDGFWSHDGSVSVMAGNRQYIENYARESNRPGMYFYAKIDPPGERLNGKAMKYISSWINPYKKDDDLVDAKNIYTVGSVHHQIYWIQESNTWFASKNSIYDSAFYKIDPYNGILDNGVAAYNHNKEADMEVKDIWVLMTLYDSSKPIITSQYCDYNGENQSLRVYLRFNEPVYASKKKTLTLKLNNSSTDYEAKYLEGNYSDTLVYELTNVPSAKFTSIKYILHDDDVGDMAYVLDAYKSVKNNQVAVTASQQISTDILDGYIDLSNPVLNVDIPSSTTPRNIYNIILSANDNGQREFNEGTVYYKWSTESSISEPKKPTSYDYSHTLTSEERGSFTVTLTKSGNINSGTYYLHALAVSKYGFTNANTFGPYQLDGDVPEISGLDISPNELQSKTYNLTLSNKQMGTSMKKIVLNATYTNDLNQEETQKLTLVEDGEKVPTLAQLVDIVEGESTTTYKYKSNIDEASASTTPIDDFIKGIMGSKSRIELTINFSIEDEAGNRVNSNSYRVTYDSRELFEVDIDVPASYAQDTDPSITIQHDVFDIANAGSEDGLTFTVTDADIKTDIDAGAKLDVIVNNEQVFDATDYSVTLKGLTPGYYEAVARVYGNTGSADIDLVSKTKVFHLTNGMNDATKNKNNVNGNLVLTNKVYQIEDIRYYYFDANTNAVNNHLYGATYNTSNGRYEGGSTSPTFSSSIEAKKYIKYMEYQDLFVMSISDNIASLLNQGSANYTKAPGETKNAQAGQLWIRYKKNSWTPNSTDSSWVFYYYGEGDASEGINTNAISSNLVSAIEMVVNRIVNYGSDKYLVQEEDLDQKTGAPYLGESQMHVETETVDVAKSGNPFLSGPVYNGDASLYDDEIEIDHIKYPLATNMVLDITPTTSLYYKALGSANWTPLEVKDGMRISEALNMQATGIYTIREYGDEGVSEFSFYLDKTLPTLKVTEDKGLETQTVLELDGKDFSKITCKSLVLNEILNEDDPYAYVAIYSYPNRKLQKVLYADDVSDYELSDGNYFLQVGDRSGNVFTYTVLTSTTTIDLTVEENEAKTGVYVKVNNRNESEIATYEVYLNDTLIDTEFAASKFYRDSGIYRIEIVDIYNNSESRVISHESPTPEITWYYLNEFDSYSIYDPNKPTRMMLEEDLTSPRTTNVYSSSLVRLIFKDDYESGDVEFEIIGLESGDYTFNSSTGSLTVNSLSGWSLRVWYANNPENDHIYVFHLDNTAPEIAATFIGTSYHYYVETEEDEQHNITIISTSSFDMIDYDKYDVGDAVTLDSLTINKNGTETISFENNAIISGSHIVIQVNDPTGIRSFTVTRNGQPLEMELNADNRLLLNSYGYYVLTFTDLLGNVSTFSFVNLETSLAVGQVDGEIMDDSILMYGHDDITINTSYNGTNTFLIKYGDESDAYIFNNDGQSVTFGQYIVKLGIEETELGDVEYKYSDLVNNENFELLINDETTKLNTWYPALITFNYAIYVMIDDDMHVNYKVTCLDQPIIVESNFSVGNVNLPSHFIAALSKEAPVVTLLNGDEVIQPKQDLEYIYIAEDLTIKNDVSTSIKTIEVSYSENPEFEKYETIYKDGDFVETFVGHEEGFYKIIVTNIYNNQTVYLISKITSFVSVVDIHTLDGSTVTFYGNDGGTIHASASIDLHVYSDSVYFIVNNISTQGYYDKGVTTLELTKEGTYTVRVMGENGIYEDFTFEIGSDETFLYQEEWITGYNEDALLKDQGYTNTFCDINIGDNVVFIDMVVNDDLHVVLYDNITESKLDDPDLLIGAIGRYGVGKYSVGFRNKYGDLVIKTVYFNNVPSLVLDRITTSDTSVYEIYDLDFAVEHDFYSNYVLRFSTTSVQYIFTINGEEYRLDEPKTIEFSNMSGNGSFSYKVTYLDEYGNYVEFYAILLRQDLAVDVSLMNTVSVTGELFTRDDIKILFGEELKATVSIDGADPVNYESGFTYYGDGQYSFVVRDIAGNRYFYTINHKSMNHYSLINSSTDETIIFGGVVNDANVTFVPEDDSRIKAVFRNGEKIEGYSSNIFSQTGHWEIIIEDQIGNLSYEEFYILNNDLCEFTYVAPFDYEVTEVWRIKPDGTREMVNYRGQTITLKENGDYVVVVSSSKTISSFNFTVTINDAPPTAKLVGAEDNNVTSQDVSLSGLKVGDVIKIYKDGELISTTTVTLSTDSPVINTGGKYTITVTNLQGVTVTYKFVRKSITNVAGSIFVIISAGAIVAGIAFGLIYHTKLKTDD